MNIRHANKIGWRMSKLNNLICCPKHVEQFTTEKHDSEMWEPLSKTIWDAYSGIIECSANQCLEITVVTVTKIQDFDSTLENMIAAYKAEIDAKDLVIKSLKDVIETYDTQCHKLIQILCERNI